jgi:hypothetical protein
MPGSKPYRRPSRQGGGLDEGPPRRSSGARVGRWLPHRAGRHPPLAPALGGPPTPSSTPPTPSPIHAPAEQIWPWLAQMGYEGRAGTYSYDLFERSTGRNLHRIDPDLHRWPPATTMPFYPGAPMTVAVADPPHALVLWQVTVGGRRSTQPGPGVTATRPGAGRSCWNSQCGYDPAADPDGLRSATTCKKAGPHSGGREIHGKDGSPVRFRRGLHT